MDVKNNGFQVVRDSLSSIFRCLDLVRYSQGKRRMTRFYLRCNESARALDLDKAASWFFLAGLAAWLHLPLVPQWATDNAASWVPQEAWNGFWELYRTRRGLGGALD